jgi:hypothetical protein
VHGLNIPCRSKPLEIWDKKVRNGHIKRITDQDIHSSVLEIMGTNVSFQLIFTFAIDCILFPIPSRPLFSLRQFFCLTLAFALSGEHKLYYVPRGPSEDARHKAAFLGHDHQES